MLFKEESLSRVFEHIQKAFINSFFYSGIPFPGLSSFVQMVDIEGKGRVPEGRSCVKGWRLGSGGGDWKGCQMPRLKGYRIP